MKTPRMLACPLSLIVAAAFSGCQEPEPEPTPDEVEERSALTAPAAAAATPAPGVDDLIRLGAEWKALRKRLTDIAAQNERANPVPGYHAGVTKDLPAALDAVEAAARSIANDADRARLRALMWALDTASRSASASPYKVSERSEQWPSSVSPYNAGDDQYKCNKFVVDAYAYGAGVGVSTQAGRPGIHAKKDANGTWAPLANQFASTSEQLRALTAAKDDTAQTPRPGDIVAYPNQGGHGHASLFVGNGLVVSAKPADGATLELLSFERTAHGNTARVRRWAP